MDKEAIDMRFKEAVEIASKMSQASLPQDVQLRLYAYYKQATHGTIQNNYMPQADLRNAFKTNAWMQISHLTENEAKALYSDMIFDLHKNGY